MATFTITVDADDARVKHLCHEYGLSVDGLVEKMAEYANAMLDLTQSGVDDFELWLADEMEFKLF